MSARFSAVTLTIVVATGLLTPTFVSLQEFNGHCVMYGQCERSPVTGLPVPCVYNGPAKPPSDPLDRELLRQLCPDFAHENAVCCDSAQLKTLRDQLSVPYQILQGCPACLHNFRNIYCYLLCSPIQSSYLKVNESSSSGQVLAVNYNLTTNFASGMFGSCEYVTTQFGETALGRMCGRPFDECTPRNWLEFVGSVSNGQTPFEMKFQLVDDPNRHSMNAPVIPCWSPNASTCQNCRNAHRLTTPSPFYPLHPCTNTSSWKEGRLNNPFAPLGYQPVEMVIQRRGKFPPIHHEFPPPSAATVDVSAVFNKSFLHQVLNLTRTIQGMNVTLNRVNFTLGDVCLYTNHSKHCTILSVLQYFQNNHTNIDKTAKDRSGFFYMEDYLDHLLFCFRQPDNRYEPLPLNMSCLADYGGVVAPYDVLCGYDDNYYEKSTALVVTFLVKDPRVSIPGAVWRNGLVNFTQTWEAKHKDVILKIYQPFWN